MTTKYEQDVQNELEEINSIRQVRILRNKPPRNAMQSADVFFALHDDENLA